MRYHVLGIGSIGTLTAHHLKLARPAAEVCLVVRNADVFRKRKHLRGDEPRPGPTLQIAQSGGDTTITTGYQLDVSNPAKQPALAQAIADGSTNVVNPGGPIDSLIVCTKTQDTSLAIGSLQSRISPSSVIALLQNGMGVYDELCAKFWPEASTRPQFILGTTTHGVTPTGVPGSVLHMSRPGQGAVKWGVVPDPRGQIDIEQWLWGRHVGGLPALSPPPSPPLPFPPAPSGIGSANLHATLEALLAMSPLSPVLLPMPHLYHELLMKLAVNAAINPLTAVLGAGTLTNGALHRSSPGHRLVQQTVTETSEILSAYLHSLSAPESAPVDTLRLFSKESVLARVTDVIAATRDNTSSMASDVKSGRPTEIDYINGYLVALGQRLGVPTPVNRMLVQMVKFKAEVRGLNRTFYPRSPRSEPLRTDDAAGGGPVELDMRRLGLEERKIALQERQMLLKEAQFKQSKGGHRSLKRKGRKLREQAVLAALEGEAGECASSRASGSGRSGRESESGSAGGSQ